MNDARNVAETLPLLLERECVVGHVFNWCAPNAFTYEEYVKYLSEVTGWPYVEVTFPEILPRWELSVGKARAMVGYEASRDVFDMIDEGWEKVKSKYS
jgi:nucleoside-diphosphate-sugar epimerase